MQKSGVGLGLELCEDQGSSPVEGSGGLGSPRSQGAQPSLPCRGELRVRVRDVGRAGERSPASTERSEVIGLRDSPRDAEGRTGS